MRPKPSLPVEPSLPVSEPRCAHASAGRLLGRLGLRPGAPQVAVGGETRAAHNGTQPHVPGTSAAPPPGPVQAQAFKLPGRFIEVTVASGHTDAHTLRRMRDGPAGITNTIFKC